MEGIHRRGNKGGGRVEVIDVRKLSENNMNLKNNKQAAKRVHGRKTTSSESKSRSSSSSSSSWWKKPEMKRRQRVAKYKLYTVEGKVKSSIKKGINWLKTRCTRIISGF